MDTSLTHFLFTALGALGIVLKLGLLETIAVIVIGNIIGCAIFAALSRWSAKTATCSTAPSKTICAWAVRTRPRPSSRTRRTRPSARICTRTTAIREPRSPAAEVFAAAQNVNCRLDWNSIDRST